MTAPNERTDALALADKLLDEPNADPDDDLRVLARQLIRVQEELNRALMTDAGRKWMSDYYALEHAINEAGFNLRFSEPRRPSGWETPRLERKP